MKKWTLCCQGWRTTKAKSTTKVREKSIQYHRGVHYLEYFPLHRVHQDRHGWIENSLEIKYHLLTIIVL